jgi:hypothetical protein
MITLNALTELSADCMAEVNVLLTDDIIAGAVLCIDEKHAVKRLNELPGIQLLVKFPSSDTNQRDESNYSESNQMLIYVIECWEAGRYSQQEELDRFNIIQEIMRKVKEYFLNNLRKLNCQLQVDKPFRTEFEYMQFGSWNGLSIAFSVKDYDL